MEKITCHGLEMLKNTKVNALVAQTLLASYIGG